jgi:hypothetical protein
LIFLFYILSFYFFISLFVPNSPTAASMPLFPNAGAGAAAAISEVPEHRCMLVVVQSFPDPDDAGRRNRGRATASSSANPSHGRPQIATVLSSALSRRACQPHHRVVLII